MNRQQGMTFNFNYLYKPNSSIKITPLKIRPSCGKTNFALYTSHYLPWVTNAFKLNDFIRDIKKIPGIIDPNSDMFFIQKMKINYEFVTIEVFTTQFVITDKNTNAYIVCNELGNIIKQVGKLSIYIEAFRKNIRECFISNSISFIMD